MTEDEYLVREIDVRVSFERSQVLALRQDEWDAANAFLYRALLESVRDLDHSIIRVYQGGGAAAWIALRAVYACADSTRSGLIYIFFGFSQVFDCAGGGQFCSNSRQGLC